MVLCWLLYRPLPSAEILILLCIRPVWQLHQLVFLRPSLSVSWHPAHGAAAESNQDPPFGPWLLISGSLLVQALSGFHLGKNMLRVIREENRPRAQRLVPTGQNLSSDHFSGTVIP